MFYIGQMFFLYLPNFYRIEGIVFGFQLAELLPKDLHLGIGPLDKLLVSLHVYAVEDHADGYLVGIQRGLVGALLLAFYIHRTQQARLLQTAEQLEHHANGQVLLRGYLTRRKRGFIGFKTTDDNRE